MYVCSTAGVSDDVALRTDLSNAEMKLWNLLLASSWTKCSP